MPIYCKSRHISTRRVDFLVENVIAFELKTVIKREDTHLAQAINYLEAYDLEIGLLINFGSRSLEFKRVQNKSFEQADQGNPDIKRNHHPDIRLQSDSTPSHHGQQLIT